jgi:hypothetical protein
MNLRSEHVWTIDVQPISVQIFVETHSVPSVTHDDDSGVLDSDKTYEKYYDVRDPMLDVLRQSYWHGWTLKGTHACFTTSLGQEEPDTVRDLLSTHSTWLRT